MLLKAFQSFLFMVCWFISWIFIMVDFCWNCTRGGRGCFFAGLGVQWSFSEIYVDTGMMVLTSSWIMNMLAHYFLTFSLLIGSASRDGAIRKEIRYVKSVIGLGLFSTHSWYFFLHELTIFIIGNNEFSLTLFRHFHLIILFHRSEVMQLWQLI